MDITAVSAKPYRTRVIEDCKMIGFLCTALADAANRHFWAPVDDDEFDNAAEGSDFAGDLEHVLMFVERAADAAEGIDPVLDQAIRKYCSWLASHGPTGVTDSCVRMVQ